VSYHPILINARRAVPSRAKPSSSTSTQSSSHRPFQSALPIETTNPTRIANLQWIDRKGIPSAGDFLIDWLAPAVVLMAISAPTQHLSEILAFIEALFRLSAVRKYKARLFCYALR
jgi:hypothetical protein